MISHPSPHRPLSPLGATEATGVENDTLRFVNSDTTCKTVALNPLLSNSGFGLGSDQKLAPTLRKKKMIPNHQAAVLACRLHSILLEQATLSR